MQTANRLVTAILLSLVATVSFGAVGCVEDSVLEGRIVGLVVHSASEQGVEGEWFVVPSGSMEVVRLRHTERLSNVPSVEWHLAEPGDAEVTRPGRILSFELDESAASVALTFERRTDDSLALLIDGGEVAIGDEVATVRKWKSHGRNDGGDASLVVPGCLPLAVLVTSEYGGDVATEWLRLFPVDTEEWDTDGFLVTVEERVELEGIPQDTAIMIRRVVRVDTLIVGSRGENVGFGFDSAEIPAMYAQRLVSIAEVLKANPELGVRIEGHTDSIGTREYNKSLGKKRAFSVFRRLTKHTVGSGKIDAVSRGEDAARDGGPGDRRAELMLIGGEGQSFVLTDTSLVADTVITRCPTPV